VTISGTYTQTFAFSFTAVMTARYTAAGPAPQTAVPAPPADRVELSSGVETAPGEPAPIEGAPPAAPPAESSPGAGTSTRPGRAAALMQALDADGNGQVSADEFTNGALALLRRAGALRRHRPDRDDDDGSADESRRVPRGLERRLDRLFNRIDRNDDGHVDAAELETALARVSRRSGGGRCGGEACEPAAQAPSIGEMTITRRVTFTAVAVRQYTFAAEGAAAPQSTVSAQA
jgi:hypothetical protein